MASFWKARWDDIRGNLIWQVLVWIAGGSLLTAVAQGIRGLSRIPFDWWFVVVVFVISALALAVITLLASRGRKVVQQQGNQALLPAPVQTPLAVDETYYGINAVVRNYWEEAIQQDMAGITDHQREMYFLHSLVCLLVASDFYFIWSLIYGSQILALEDLNRAGNAGLTRDQLLPRYQTASSIYSLVYIGFTFDHWLAFLRNQGLASEANTQIVIQPKGREFLGYLINNGRSAADRLY